MVNLHDAPCKCAFIEIQCIIILVNAGSVDKSQVKAVIEELFFKDFRISSLVDSKWYLSFVESIVYLLSHDTYNYTYNYECKLLLRICLELATEIGGEDLILRYRSFLLDNVIESGHVDDILNTANTLCQNADQEITTYVGSQIWNNSISLYRQQNYNDANMLSIKAEEILSSIITSSDTLANIKEFRRLVAEKLN